MKITKLTTEQENLMLEVRDFWIKTALLEGDEIDEAEAEKGINWIYDLSGIKHPRIIYADSPLAIQLILNSNSVSNSVWNSVWNSVRNSVWNSVWNSVRNSVWNSVRNSVWNSVSNSVRNSVWNSVRNSVWNSVSNSVRNSVWNSVRNSVWNSVSNSVWNSVENSVSNSVWNSVENSVRNSVWNTKLNWYGYHYYDLTNVGWLSFYDFFGRIDLFDKKDQENLDKYIAYMKSGVWLSSYNKDYAIVGRRPKVIKRNEFGQLHSDNSPAIEWRDGFKIYFLNGVEFPEKLYLKVVSGEMPFSKILAIDDIDQRTQAMRFGNADEFFKQTKAVKLDSSKRGNELYLIPKESGIFTADAFYLRYSCPSTGKVYMSGVSKEVGETKNADACMAWKHNLSLDAYQLLNVEA